MGFAADGATYGKTLPWSVTFSVSKGTQTINFNAEHTVYVYFANVNPPFSYYVIDVAAVSADPGEALRNDKDGRGNFNSSTKITYKTVSASDNCRVTRTAFGPSGMANKFSYDFIGTEMVLNANKQGGDGSVVFKPTETMNPDATVQGWGIVPASNGWTLHQKDVWNALGNDGPGSVRVTAKMLDDLFEGTPFGNVAPMPDASFYPVNCSFVTMWQITKTSGEFKQDARAVTLTLETDYNQRLTTLVNGKVEPDRDAMRKSFALQPPSDLSTKRELQLHLIAPTPPK